MLQCQNNIYHVLTEHPTLIKFLSLHVMCELPIADALYLRTRLRMYTYVYVCMYVCMYIYIYIYIMQIYAFKCLYTIIINQKSIINYIYIYYIIYIHRPWTSRTFFRPPRPVAGPMTGSRDLSMGLGIRPMDDPHWKQVLKTMVIEALASGTHEQKIWITSG